MIEADCPPPLPWRADAPFLAATASVGVLAASALFYEPLTSLPNLLGPAADAVARDLCDAVGLGVVPLVFGAGHVVARYAARERSPRLLGRAGGWLVTTAATAGLADLAFGAGQFPAVSAFGRGGSLGAATAFSLADIGSTPAPALALLALLGGGLILAAGGAVERGLHLTRVAVTMTVREVVTGLRLAVGATRRGAGRAWRLGREAVELPGAFASRLRAWLTTRRRPPVIALAAADPVAATPPADAPASALPLRPGDTPPPRAPVPRLAPLPPIPAGPTSPGTVPITRPPAPLVTPAAAAPPPAGPRFDASGYEFPSMDLLADPVAHPELDREQRLRDRAALLEKTFTDFGLTVKVVGIHTGPVITQYEVELATGLRLSRVTTLSDDLALCLGVASVRIVAPLPGRNTVGIEVPNDHRQTVRLKELMHATADKSAGYKLPIFLGKDVEGRPLVYDLAAMPHLLIAGRTGTGKSVCLNAVILSMLYTRSPEDCRLILIDPKQVEFATYESIPHLMHPVVTDAKKSEAILAWAVDKMEERYELLRRSRTRNLAAYNELGFEELLRRIDPQTDEERQAIPRRLPYIVIVLDEVGDLLMSMKKEVEGHIIRLAQKSRAAGVHLILATQRPTVDVITGLIKSNLPARICFQVASRADSAVVLDEKGADKLLGMGDMLFLQPGTSTIVRAQGAYVDDREIERTAEALSIYEENFESELLNLKTRDTEGGDRSGGVSVRDRDPLYEQAVEIVIREQRGSTSLLQRALGIGYGKASRFIDFMHEDGVVGAYNGSNARDVLVSAEEWALRRG